MGVHNPAALPLLVVLGVLVLLYLRRRTRTRIEVPGFLFWDAVPEDRVRARRFRPDPLFYLQALLLALLVSGLLHPYWARTVTETHGRRHVLVLDRSASMQAREDGRTRFDAARDLARDVVRAAAPLDEIMLVGVAARPTVLSGFTTDHRLVRHRLDALRPLDTGTHLDAGIELAVLQRDRAGRQARVHVFTDVPASTHRRSEGRALTWHRVGETDDNVAVAAVHVSQPPFQDAAAARAYVLVRNYAARGKAATLRASLNGRPVFEEAFRLPARETRSFALRGFDGPGRLDVALETDDALAVDDRALAWIAARRDLRLVLVSPDPRFADEVRRVSRVLPGVGLVHVAPEEFSPARIQAGDVALFHRFVPAGAVPANGLYVFPPADNPRFPVRAAAADVRILDWNADHAILRNVQYVDALPVGGVRVLDPPRWAQVLISSRTTHGEIPLALAGEHAGRRVVCLAFDLDAGALTDADNLTLLVLFLNALRWLQPPDPAAPKLLPVGAPFFVPDGVDGLRLSVPGADARPLDDDTFGLDRAGVYRIAGDAYRALLYANLFDEAESDIGRADVEEGDDPVTAVSATDPRIGTRTVERAVPVEFGRWLYWLAAALLAGEWLYALVRERRGHPA